MWRKEETTEEGREEKSKRGARGRGAGEEGRGPPYTILAVVPLVGKWVYKRGPDDSISTHDPTFIPISPNGFLSSERA